ncbi:tannase and feruloyl esterase [Hypoxylon trugodes]|uniref:tannase and feruloyl esterase n=1 Tax=Hypoxylon trugodes TaxID=326681 RepID=UPI0021930115|nr:tannase and feruloyl esterase [Hypoxylon trugodes]KAI1389666.1 tannase and feruloyl esterase [Hypoxylon trugodes]
MASLLANHSCTTSTFSTLTLFGAEILSVDANPVTNYNFDVPTGWRYSQPAVNVQDAGFCNVTVTYTHPGKNDTISIETWLPTADDWNGRLQALGGGGWVAGRFALTYGGMAGAIHDGYATVTTDAGVPDASFPTWAVLSPGNLDLVSLDNLGHASLNDAAAVAKDVIQRYYGRGPSYSYWNGCSNGGRQASVLAQQYPTAYDGIIAAAPALYWAELLMATSWPVFYMDLTGQYPYGCELTRITTLAVAACDELDGVRDGLIAEPEECRRVFSPKDYIGTVFNCSNTGQNMELSSTAVSVAEAMWDGPTYSNGEFMWYGFEIGSDLSTVASTICTEDHVCAPATQDMPFYIYQTFVLKDFSANVTKLTHSQFDSMYRSLKRAFSSSMAATESNIIDFRESGGKMITYHGLADPSITPRGTLHYYKEASRTLQNITEFYRYYRVPGLEHCWGGNGGQPEALFSQLRLWVENGTAPEASPVKIQQPANVTRDEILCPYPKKATFRTTCANSTSTVGCWSCE